MAAHRPASNPADPPRFLRRWGPALALLFAGLGLLGGTAAATIWSWRPASVARVDAAEARLGRVEGAVLELRTSSRYQDQALDSIGRRLDVIGGQYLGLRMGPPLPAPPVAPRDDAPARAAARVLDGGAP